MNDLVSHEDIISTITRLIDAGKLPHLLLYGPPGTGKTSTILACAHKLYGKHFSSMVLELNASDDRGIDGVAPARRGATSMWRGVPWHVGKHVFEHGRFGHAAEVDMKMRR